MHQSRKPVVRSLALFFGGLALGALWRARRPEPVTHAAEAAPVVAAPVNTFRQQRPFRARLAAASTFAALFVAGGALSAWGGNQASSLLEDAGSTAAAADTTTAESVPAASVAADPVPATTADVVTIPAEAPADEVAATPTSTAAAPAAPQPVPVQLPVRVPPVTPPRHHVQRRAVQVAVRRASTAPDPEVNEPGAASIVWLNRALPDPTPPSRRLERAFVRMLYASVGSEWPLALAVLRSDGLDGRAPAGAQALQALAGPLGAAGADERQAALSLLGDATLADRATALAHYYSAVGTETLVEGLDASKARLERRLLADPRVSIYPAGRADVESGRVNVRVLAVIAYLADSFGSVEVSSLVSGHREFARPRVLSAHVFGEAVDVAGLGGVSIASHQEPGGLAEQAVRALLLLPAEVEPRQIISLLGLGGPSFALADHADHVHVGF